MKGSVVKNIKIRLAEKGNLQGDHTLNKITINSSLKIQIFVFTSSLDAQGTE